MRFVLNCCYFLQICFLGWVIWKSQQFFQVCVFLCVCIYIYFELCNIVYLIKFYIRVIEIFLLRKENEQYILYFFFLFRVFKIFSLDVFNVEMYFQFIKRVYFWISFVINNFVLILSYSGFEIIFLFYQILNFLKMKIFLWQEFFKK